MSIPYGRQEITDDDVNAVVEVLKSPLITQGKTVPAFEQVVADYCGAGHAIAVNSATSALHIACLALDVGPGDLVWTSAISFVASSNSALYCGAEVDFVDIDPDTFNISVGALAAKLETSSRPPKVVIAVHMCGQPCDMPAIEALSKQYGFRVIEDAAHAIGASQGQLKTGACEFSDIAILSFHPVKIITTGEGGMALTNDAVLARRMELLRTHCVTREPHELEQEPDGPWYYEQIGLGFNYRMTDIHAALGLSQMSRLDSYVDRRNALAKRYDELLRQLPLDLPEVDDDVTSSFHLYVIRLQPEVKSERLRVFCGLREKGIGVNLHYIPIYRQPHYQRIGFPQNYCPNAEDYYERAITIPLFAAMSESEQDTVVKALIEELSH